ncbi:MAG: T9SS type A sorting domain-containing protein [Bacteroidaceae bacterium]|nr:T9SS type A sorting domain-containing protein [Bacteroidaceae bacterium]MBR1902268.1 T9SS type A sorting domain-containing protein [Bacteroidaceae bacterium]
MKKILLIVLPLMLVFAPAFAMEYADNENIENNMSAVAIAVSGNTVRVSGTNGEDIEVFNLTGVKITTIKTDTTGKTFTVNLQKGCYLLKIGKVVRKISIR